MKNIGLNFNKKLIILCNSGENNNIMTELFEIMGFKSIITNSTEQFKKTLHEAKSVDGTILFMDNSFDYVSLLKWIKSEDRDKLKTIIIVNEEIMKNSMTELDRLADCVIISPIQLGKLKSAVEKCWG